MQIESSDGHSERHRAAVQASLDALLSGASMADAAAAADAVFAGGRDLDDAST